MFNTRSILRLVNENQHYHSQKIGRDHCTSWNIWSESRHMWHIHGQFEADLGLVIDRWENKL